MDRDLAYGIPLHCIVQVAAEGGALTLGGISQCPFYLSSMTKADMQNFKKEINVFVSREDGLPAVRDKNRHRRLQYYRNIKEMEWAIEECLKSDLLVAASMCIGPERDMHNVSAAECAIQMAQAGAHTLHAPDVGKQGFIDLPVYGVGPALEERVRDDEGVDVVRA